MMSKEMLLNHCKICKKKKIPRKQLPKENDTPNVKPILKPVTKEENISVDQDKNSEPSDRIISSNKITAKKKFSGPNKKLGNKTDKSRKHPMAEKEIIALLDITESPTEPSSGIFFFVLKNFIERRRIIFP